MHSNETGNLSLFHLLSLCTKPLCDQSIQFNLNLFRSTLPLHIFVTVSYVLLCKLKLFRSNAPTQYYLSYATLTGSNFHVFG